MLFEAFGLASSRHALSAPKRLAAGNFNCRIKALKSYDPKGRLLPMTNAEDSMVTLIDNRN